MSDSLFLLQKILVQGIFPPGIIIILIILLYALLIFQKKKIATILTLFLVISLFLLGSWYGEYFLLRPLENKYTSGANIAGYLFNLSKPIIVVLSGNGNNVNQSTGSNNGEVGEITQSRLLGAYFLYQETHFPVLVSGGIAPGCSGDIASADQMERFLVKLGIPVQDIMKENRSGTTMENAIFVLDLMRTHHFEQAILVTSAVHMTRAMLAFQNDSIKVIPAPVNFLYENINPGILATLPNRSSWEHNLRALHEWAGIIYYKMRFR